MPQTVAPAKCRVRLPRSRDETSQLLTRAAAVAVLTRRIALMTEHLQAHPHDRHSRLGLMGMLANRRKLLQYLRRTDGDVYAKTLSALGLKDVVQKA